MHLRLAHLRQILSSRSMSDTGCAALRAAAPDQDTPLATAAAIPPPVRVEITVSEEGSDCSGSPTRLRLLAAPAILGSNPPAAPAASPAARPAALGGPEFGAEGVVEEEEEEEKEEEEVREQGDALGAGEGENSEPITPTLQGASPVKPPVRAHAKAA